MTSQPDDRFKAMTLIALNPNHNAAAVVRAFSQDTFTRHCHVETGNDSYCFQQSRHQAKVRIKSRQQVREWAGALTP